MANPQAEEGHVDIANEIVEALARTRISGSEMQILWVIFRKTYGWHKKEDEIALSQFTEMTGIPKPHVVRYLKKLLHKKVIAIAQNGNGITSYGFNKDFDKWSPLPKKVTLPKMVTSIAQNGKASLPKKAHTKETTTKETITKEIKIVHGEFKNVKLTEEEHKKLIVQFGEHGTQDRIENLSQYIASKGKKYSSHYATILSWERKNNPEGVSHVATGTDGAPLGKIERRLWEAEKRLRGHSPEATEKNS